MKERPILFSGSMVRAVLEGRKSQTRRVCPVLIPSDKNYIHVADHKEWAAKRAEQCPYGIPGDRLWVRETWTPYDLSVEMKPSEMPRDSQIVYLADQKCKLDGDKYYPSIHMPRWASRITLEITGVRVERLQDISREDAIAEGIQVLPLQSADDPSAWWQSAPGIHQERTPQASYRALWDDINGKRAPWHSNPWVWAISFQMI